MPLGIFAARRPRLGAPLVGLANIVQTIPSLAMFGFLLPLPLVGGIGARAALVVLILYGLLPIVRTTIAGLNGIDRSIREAGVAMGMTARELLRQVELPLALPSIVAGIACRRWSASGPPRSRRRSAPAASANTSTAGCRWWIRRVILAGAVPAAVLALVVDGGLLWLERQLSARRHARGPACHRRRRGGHRRGADRVERRVAAPIAAAGSSSARRTSPSRSSSASSWRRRSSARPALPVERRLNLGGTLICDRALLSGDIDVYVEYTGTALTAVFHQPLSTDPQAVFDTCASATRAPAGRCCRRSASTTRSRFWCAAATRASAACARSTTRRGQAPQWRAGFGYEFLERPDGYPGLAQGLRPAVPGPAARHGPDPELSRARLGQVDVIAGDATAGLIEGLDLVRLEDNRHYFPPYDAVPVARAATLLRYPAHAARRSNAGRRISAADMRR